jgi:hypothetical protein
MSDCASLPTPNAGCAWLGRSGHSVRKSGLQIPVSRRRRHCKFNARSGVSFQPVKAFSRGQRPDRGQDQTVLNFHFFTPVKPLAHRREFSDSPRGCECGLRDRSNRAAKPIVSDFKGAALGLASYCSVGAISHRPEIMFGMLIVVFCADRVTGLCFGASQFEIVGIALLRVLIPI